MFHNKNSAKLHFLLFVWFIEETRVDLFFSSDALCWEGRKIANSFVFGVQACLAWMSFVSWTVLDWTDCLRYTLELFKKWWHFLFSSTSTLLKAIEQENIHTTNVEIYLPKKSIQHIITIKIIIVILLISHIVLFLFLVFEMGKIDIRWKR